MPRGHQVPVIALKRSAYLRSYLTKIIQVAWCNRKFQRCERGLWQFWFIKKTLLTIQQTSAPSLYNQYHPLKVFTSAVRNNLFVYLMKNNYIETLKAYWMYYVTVQRLCYNSCYRLIQHHSYALREAYYKVTA